MENEYKNLFSKKKYELVEILEVGKEVVYVEVKKVHFFTAKIYDLEKRKKPSDIKKRVL